MTKPDLLPDRKYDGKCFEVFQYANFNDSSDPRYFQYFEAKEPEELELVAKLIEHIPSDAQTGFGAYTDERIIVQQHSVWSRSGTGYEAIRRFRDWLEMGYPVEWLLDPSFKKEVNNA